MVSQTDDLATSRRHDTAQRPRDAATLIVVRRDAGGPRVLMGQRHARHSFMPGKYVFPGGRYDAIDGRIQPAGDMPPETLRKLCLSASGRMGAARARGLGLTALRETFEETGYIVGRRAVFKGPGAWAEFAATGHAPDLSGLVFIGRAITPPGRTRRFDSRFFAVDARHLANADTPAHAGSGELEAVRWVSFPEALGLDLPEITADTLTRLREVLESGGFPSPADPVPFQRQRNGRWVRSAL